MLCERHPRGVLLRNSWCATFSWLAGGVNASVVELEARDLYIHTLLTAFLARDLVYFVLYRIVLFLQRRDGLLCDFWIRSGSGFNRSGFGFVFLNL